MEMTIGEVGRRTGLPTSTIRYYEKIGLLPKPIRRSTQRRYDETILGRIGVVRATLDAGFTLAEAREFILGVASDAPPSVRWKTLAAAKLEEMDERLRQITRMKTLLKNSFDCACVTLEDCERSMQASERPRATDGPDLSRPNASGCSAAALR